MQPDLAAMQAAGADLDEYLGCALEVLEEPHDGLTPAQADRADQLAQSYLALAGAALSRVEDAARGATERTAHGA